MRHPARTNCFKLDQSGFTLVELVIVIVVLGILAAVAIPKFGAITESSKITATKKEMMSLKLAIGGNPEVVAGGKAVDRGFEGDVGFIPSRLADLAVKPDSIQAYNKLSRLGWNGPYIDSANGSYLTDAWGAAYIYQPSSRRFISTSTTDSIFVYF